MPSVPGLMMLGLLGEREGWTAYDLVKHLTTRSIAPVVWSVSERTLYREPAKLVAEGLATASEGEGRPTVYAITDRGREVAQVIPLGEDLALERRIADLQAAGILGPSPTSSIHDIQPIAHRPGALERFLKERD